MGEPVQAAAEQKLARIRLLSDELDRLRISALERTRSIETKASFVVVAAGVVAVAAFGGLSTSKPWWLALITVALTIATVTVAAVALWPAKMNTTSARDIVTEWVEADLTLAELEDNLLEVKTVEIEERDAKNESRAYATKWAFGLLVTSLVAALITAAITAATTNGGT